MKKMAGVVFIVFLCVVAGWAAEMTASLEGRQFGPESKNCVQDNGRISDGAKLYGSFGSGIAIYELRVSEKADQLGAEVDFINARKKKLSVYIYNFGTAQDANPAHSGDVDRKWWLWGDSEEDNWKAPSEQKASDGTGRMALVNPEGKVRILLHAPGGIPYLTDGLFFISRISLAAQIPDQIPESGLEGFQASDNAWIEGGVVAAKGIGKPPQGMDPAKGRILALRAAKVVAMRNLLISLGNVHREDGTLYVQGTLQGVKVRDEKDLPDGSVEVTVEMPEQ